MKGKFSGSRSLWFWIRGLTSILQLHTIQVHDASGDPKTAEQLLKQMLLAISTIETKWGATVIACTTDASGESWKARHLLQAKFPRLVVPDCLAHQLCCPLNLMTK